MTNWAKALGDVGYFQPELEKVSTVLTNLHNLEKQKRIADQIKTKIQGLGTTSDKPVAATTAKPAQTVKTETKTPTSIADLMANKPPEDVVDRPAVIDTPTAAPKEPQFFASTRLYGMPADDNIDRPFVGGQPALGNVDLFNRKAVALNDGSGNRATVNSASFNIDGKEVLLPTVSDDGKLLSNDEAIAQYKATGKHLGKFDTIPEADKYADALHLQQEQQMKANDALDAGFNANSADYGKPVVAPPQQASTMPSMLDLFHGKAMGEVGGNFFKGVDNTQTPAVAPQAQQVDEDYLKAEQLKQQAWKLKSELYTMDGITPEQLKSAYDYIDGYVTANTPEGVKLQNMNAGDQLTAVKRDPKTGLYGSTTISQAAFKPTADSIVWKDDPPVYDAKTKKQYTLRHYVDSITGEDIKPPEVIAQGDIRPSMRVDVSGLKPVNAAKTLTDADTNLNRLEDFYKNAYTKTDPATGTTQTVYRGYVNGKLVDLTNDEATAEERKLRNAASSKPSETLTKIKNPNGGTMWDEVKKTIDAKYNYAKSAGVSIDSKTWAEEGKKLLDGLDENDPNYSNIYRAIKQLFKAKFDAEL